MPVSGVDVAVAARACTALVSNGQPVPAILAAVRAAGFGPHDAWPHQLAAVTLDRLKTSRTDPAAAASFVEASAPAVAAVGGADRQGLADWLRQVGDPAWDAVDAETEGTVTDRIVGARTKLAAGLVRAVVDATVDAAQRAADHHKAVSATHKAEDDARLQRWADDNVRSDLQAEEQRQVDEDRAYQLLKAMWPR